MTEALRIYHNFIDDITHLNNSVLAHWVMIKGFPDIEDNNDVNKLLARLSKEDKQIIAGIVTQSRQGGIHDLLVYLQDNINLKGLTIYKKGIEMANEPYGTTMYWDYVARSEGDEWPDWQLDERYK